MPKPFIAARIPQTVADKLEERAKDSGHGKTDIIINALAQYLGCSIDVPEETRAVDRLVTVEKELTELRNRIEVLERPSKSAIQRELLLDNNTVNKIDKDCKLKEDLKGKIVQKVDNSIDKIIENTLELTTPEVVKRTGITRKTLENRYKVGKLPFTSNGYTVLEKIGIGKTENGKRSNLWKVQKFDNKSD